MLHFSTDSDPENLPDQPVPENLPGLPVPGNIRNRRYVFDRKVPWYLKRIAIAAFINNKDVQLCIGAQIALTIAFTVIPCYELIVSESKPVIVALGFGKLQSIRSNISSSWPLYYNPKFAFVNVSSSNKCRWFEHG